MTAITVRDVPDETGDELARKPGLTTVIERVQARKSTTGSRLDRAAILELKDAGRR
jgi:hypothetical protein